MSLAKIIDGKKIAEELRKDIAKKTKRFELKYKKVPSLTVIQVGENPASSVYVRNKEKFSNEVGFKSTVYLLDENITQETLIEKINELNNNKSINGILVQLPLPKHIDEDVIIKKVMPLKDVDCFHPQNVGNLYASKCIMPPCTPSGCMHLIRSVMNNLQGKKALVIGRSNIVGKPMAKLLLDADATVTIAHSKTADLKQECLNSDIVVAAVGIPNFVKGDWIKKGAVVIDVGINRIADDTKKSGYRLCGDVCFEEASKNALAITPVPGGVGPMTIAMLLRNTLQAFCTQNKIGDFEI